MTFNHTQFFDLYRQHFGSLTQPQVDGIEFLLTSIENDAPLWSGSQSITIDQAAYMLATVKHETADAFQPIDEIGGNIYFNRRYGPQTKIGQRLGNTQSGDGALFHGRGYVQLTGRSNYARATTDLAAQYPTIAVDLVANPKQAKDAAVAYAVMSFGMQTGRFTGHQISEFFNASRQDPVNARRIINGLDRAQLVAGYWSGIAAALRTSVNIDVANSNVDITASGTPNTG
jgi:putative chitinase